MEIKLQSLSLLNFKGIKEFAAEFSDLTSISADNGVGKTTIHDAFTWLLFGKDSTDSKVFEIKTLDKNNRPIHNLDHQVTGEIMCGGTKTTFRRVYKEKWQKKRGEDTPEFTGHTTDYYVDDVPHNQKEYQTKVDSLVDEQVFKTITSSSYFNSLQWTQRREILDKVAGTVTDQDIAGMNPKFKEILDEITHKSLEGYKKELAAKRKVLKESLSEIPSRISEVNRSMPEAQDYPQIEKDLIALAEKRDKIAQQIEDSSKMHAEKNNENQKVQNRIYEVESTLAEIRQQVKLKNEAAERNAGAQTAELKGEAISIQRGIERIQADVKDLESKKDALEKKAADLREGWSKKNSKSIEFKMGEFLCPTCKRELDPDTIELRKSEMITSFNKSKSEALNDISQQGAQCVKQIAEITDEINTLNEMIDEKNQKIKEIQEAISKAEKDASAPIKEQRAEDLPEYKQLQDEIERLKPQIKQVTFDDNTDLKLQSTEIYGRMDDLKTRLSQKAIQERAKTRLEELKRSEREFSQQLADLEKMEFLVKGFETEKVNQIEAKVNKMFSLVQFKMFNELINGGYEPTCEAMIDGVPFSSLSNAERINAGIDIINTLSGHFDVTAPIWVDNAESISRIIPTESQLIRLVVVEGLNDLKVTAEKKEFVEP